MEHVKNRCLITIVLGLCFLAPIGTVVHGAPEPEKPNIVFVFADDLGWTDVNANDPLNRGFYETPNINRLAEQGLRFTRAYSGAANCAPTRAALMSGQYYPNQPIYHVGSPSKGKLIPAPNAKKLPLEKVTMAEALKQSGYATGLVGKWHIGNPPDAGPRQQGFDLNVGGYNAGNPGNWDGGYFAPNNNPYIDDAREDEYLTKDLIRKASTFIKNHREQPFYLQLSLYTPHVPLQAPDDLVEKYRQKEGERGHNNPTYAAMLEVMDRGVGRLMDLLEKLELAEETIFVFYSDNGGSGSFKDLGRNDNGITDNSPLKGGKGSFYEGGIRVPLILRWPGRIEAGTTTDEPVTSIDFYPTFLEAAGMNRSELDGYDLDGQSMMPLFRDPGGTLDRDALFWHFPGYPNHKWRTTPVSVIQSGPWKLMKFYEDRHLELYNLNEDLGEQTNLADERPDKRRELHQRLMDWLDEHDAPMPKRR